MVGRNGGTASFGKQEWVVVANLKVDPNYQRPLNQKRVEDMAENFDPEIFGELIVSRRKNGEEFVLDGQHRLGTLRVMKWDDQRVPALVHEGLTREQEADIFRLFNLRRTRPSPIDLFHAAVAGKDPLACEIKKAINRVGMEVASGTALTITGSPGKYVNAVGKLMAIGATPNGIGIVKTVLDVATTAWGVSHTSVSSPILDGLGRFFAIHGKAVHIPHLVKVLAKMSPTDLHSQARSLLNISGAYLGVSVAIVVEARYNSRAGQFRVPDTSSSRYTLAFRGRPTAEKLREKVQTQPRVNGRFAKKGKAA